MIKKILLLMVILFLNNHLLFSQLPGCDSCKSIYKGPQYYKKIPYKYCDPTKNPHAVVQVCTEGGPPTNPSPYIGPLKLCLPLSITYDNQNLPTLPSTNNGTAWSEIINDQTLATENNFYFDDSDMPNLITAAIGYWQDLCPNYKTEGCSPCSVKIMWTKDASKLGSDYDHASHVQNPLTNDCKYDCSQLAIILNGTSAFTGPKTNGKFNTFFFTEGSNATNGYGTKLQNIDMRTEIMHQLGILLGLGNTPPYTDDGSNQCGDYISVMSGINDPGNDNFQVQGNRIKSLAPEPSSSINPPHYIFTPVDNNVYKYDRCAFELLYCCLNTDVEENRQGNILKFEISPNPSISDLTISINQNKGELTTISIYDVLGNKLESVSGNIFLEPGSYQFIVDLTKYDNGTYFCFYQHGSLKEIKLFEVIH